MQFENPEKQVFGLLAEHKLVTWKALQKTRIVPLLEPNVLFAVDLETLKAAVRDAEQHSGRARINQYRLAAVERISLVLEHREVSLLNLLTWVDVDLYLVSAASNVLDNYLKVTFPHQDEVKCAPIKRELFVLSQSLDLSLGHEIVTDRNRHFLEVNVVADCVDNLLSGGHLQAVMTRSAVN